MDRKWSSCFGQLATHAPAQWTQDTHHEVADLGDDGRRCEDPAEDRHGFPFQLGGWRREEGGGGGVVAAELGL